MQNICPVQMIMTLQYVEYDVLKTLWDKSDVIYEGNFYHEKSHLRQNHVAKNESSEKLSELEDKEQKSYTFDLLSG